MIQGLVTILLTSYNRPIMIRDAINSVLNQTYKNWELFVLDDNSNEGTLEVIRGYLVDPRIRFFRTNLTENHDWLQARYAVNINDTIDKINGEFTTYLTDDDYFMPRRLECMVKYFNQHPEAGVVYGRQLIMRGNANGGLRAPDKILNWAAGSVDHCSIMHKTSCFEKSGKWPTHNIRCADGEFWASLNRAGYNFYPVLEITDVHRYHHQELSSKIDRGEMDSGPRE